MGNMQNKKLGFEKKDFIDLFLLVMSDRKKTTLARIGLEENILELLQEDRYQLFSSAVFPNKNDKSGLELEKELENQQSMGVITYDKDLVTVIASQKYITNVINIYPSEYVETMIMFTGEYLSNVEEDEKEKRLVKGW